ncbi:ribose transport system substrate-binding protein [Nocardioides zeae]|uniref:Ribose transport system substrate-binding protein n=1 Tax=Nocardioides zeae TaxID=1457234 RepID=A0ACC6IF22_9ACTN|nr:substrate-binding domain-containing protein [Nocardioides zeae]MDR6174869.1 ribose transport system substrate-binding protein [Nocardioides zeae]MDR6209321.1 ribose transport system substrate-binding protein [Nocardioides zeae]
MLKKSTKIRALTIVSAASLVGSLAACGSSTTSGGGSTDADVLTTAEEQVAALYEGTEGTPPTDGPAAVSGKKVWVISCGQAAVGCSVPTNAAVDAANEIGWDTTLYDGAFGANDGYNNGIRQAVAAGTDGIILIDVACGSVEQSLTEAQTAGIQVMSYEGHPCEDDATLTNELQYNSDITSGEAFATSIGEANAWYLIDQLGGEGTVLDFQFVDNQYAMALDAGFQRVMETAPGISVETATINLSDYSNPSTFQQKTSAALLGAPTATGINAPFASFILGGVGQAVTSSGREIATITGDGYEANMTQIASGRGQTAAMAYDSTWIGWALVDSLNRLLAGQQPVPAGIGLKLVDKDHNLPSSGDYATSVDFKTAYEAIWEG